MANPTSTSVDLGSVALEGEAFADDLLTFGGAATYAAGTILARDSSTLKYIAFVKGGVTNGNGVPKAVLTYDVVAAGAGDIKVRALIKGLVKKQRLIIIADGNDSNVDAAVRDQLRAFGITPIDALQTSS
jgi:hypothetical protein